MNSLARRQYPEANILVLEDDPVCRALVVETLGREGHHLHEAADLAAAWRIAAEIRPDLVLCDIRLDNNESGLDFFKEVAVLAPELAVVMMTGVADTQTAVDCLRNGAFDFLSKPFDGPRLQLVVARALERRNTLLAERRRAEEHLALLGRFSSENPNPVLRVSREGRVLYANRASESLLRQFECAVGERAPQFLRQLVTGALGSGQQRHIDVEASPRIFSFAVVPIAGADYVYLYGHDVTRLKETERELVRLRDQALDMAVHDPLTGLPNRVLLQDRLEQALALAERTRRKLAVAFLDLDHFKHVNDAHGHRAGDEVLMQVACRLRDASRKTDTIARWGGDEMILLLPNLKNTGEAHTVCDRLKNAVAQCGLPVTVSLGVAVYPDDGLLPDALLQRADAALYQAKARGRNQIVFHGAVPEAESRRLPLNLRDRLEAAVAAHRITVHYQPILETSTGKVAAVEALARWTDPEQGPISPATFIPLAEAMGLIGPLSRQVMSAAARQFAAWKCRGLVDSLALNFSIRQLLEVNLVRDLMETTAACGVQPREIILEMTESQALVGLASEERRLEELSRHGFQISIDDFGQGYSSLSSLYSMPVTELKLDMKFVRNIQTGKGRRVVQAILEMARVLGLRTVAEGVATGEEARIIREMKPDRLQGYFFSRPAPAGPITAMLEGRTG